MKRNTSFFAVLLAIALLLSACAPAAAPTATSVSTPAATRAPTAPSLILKDGLGRSVTLAGPALKIVSMAPSNTEILYAIGAGSSVIGRDEFSDYPAEAKNLPSVGGSMGKYNFEQIAKLQPDLVLASSLNTPEQVKALEDLKITVYVLTNPITIDGLYTNLETVGQLSGHSSDAAKLVDSLKQRVKVVTDAVGKATNQPKVFYELDGTDPAKPWTAGPGSYVDTFIKMAGGVNAAASLNSDYAQISQEELIAANPDIILLGDGAYGVTPDQVAQRPGWNGISAVQNKKVLTFDDNTVSRPGPRLADGLEMLYKIMHP
jgi:iron complex transport system substrate-binding protein